MAGTLLGPDQVRKINAAYPALVAHITTLLSGDHTGVGLMKVHAMVESFDSDEMARIFRELTFISNREKLALVRAAVYEVMATNPALFRADKAVEAPREMPSAAKVEEPKVYTPPQFKLNVNRAADIHGMAPADTPKPQPIVTSTHTPIVAANLEAGAKEAAAQQAKLDEAVAKFREAAAPKPIEIMEVPADTVIAIDPALDGADQTVVAEVAPDGTIEPK